MRRPTPRPYTPSAPAMAVTPNRAAIGPAPQCCSRPNRRLLLLQGIPPSTSPFRQQMLRKRCLHLVSRPHTGWTAASRRPAHSADLAPRRLQGAVASNPSHRLAWRPRAGCTVTAGRCPSSSLRCWQPTPACQSRARCFRCMQRPCSAVPARGRSRACVRHRQDLLVGRPAARSPLRRCGGDHRARRAVLAPARRRFVPARQSLVPARPSPPLLLLLPHDRALWRAPRATAAA